MKKRKKLELKTSKRSKVYRPTRKSKLRDNELEKETQSDEYIKWVMRNNSNPLLT